MKKIWKFIKKLYNDIRLQMEYRKLEAEITQVQCYFLSDEEEANVDNSEKTDIEIFTALQPALRGGVKNTPEMLALLVEAAKRWANSDDRTPCNAYQLGYGSTLWMSSLLVPCTVQQTIRNRYGDLVGIIVQFELNVFGIRFIIYWPFSVRALGRKLFPNPWEAACAYRK